LPTRVGLRLLGSISAPVQERIVADLARIGLVVDSDPQGQHDLRGGGSYLVVFDHLTGEVFEELRTAGTWGRHRVLAIALPSATLDNSDAWSLLQSGASDVVRWDERDPPVRAVAARLERWAEIDGLMRSDAVQHTLIGNSPTWIAVLRQVVEVAAFTQTAVLLTGESGTGKELVARLIHRLDRRPDKGPFVVLDCTTVVPTLSGSEFFGHERGAFTGAVAPRDGAFARANGGTLFLDEVGELPLTLQAELLRVIQEGMYKRVGGDTWRDTTFRLVCATNRPLRDTVKSGGFRSDLYHRIAAWGCELPPLRERMDDILPLAAHFLSALIPSLGRPPFDPAVTDFISHRDYPGNVRDLRLLIARIAARHVGDGSVTVGSLPDSERPEGKVDARTWWQGSFEKAIGNAVGCGVDLREIGKRAQDTAIAVAVAAEGGSLRRAAVRLGVTERALQMRRSAANLSTPSGVKKGQVSQPEIVPRPRDHPDRVPGQTRVAEAHVDEEGGEPRSSV
jgi:transcriptional regulator with GAF, ATPase, and Fis domain